MKRTRIPKVAYNGLMFHLRRAGYASSGKLARILLENFVFEDGRFSAETFYKEKLIPEKSFTTFRQKLKADGFIDYTDGSARRQEYYPTARILPFIKKAREDAFATRTYVDANIEKVQSNVDKVADDVQDLRAQMNEIHELLAELKRLQAPPPSEEAQKKSAKIAERLDVLVRRKSAN